MLILITEYIPQTLASSAVVETKERKAKATETGWEELAWAYLLVLS